MKIASIIARYLLGLTFTVFGLNGFLHFLPMGSMPPMAMQFFTVLSESHYLEPIFALQLICGLMFLTNFYVPLALVMIAPVIVNILLFHILMLPAGIVPGLVATACWFLVFFSVRRAFDGILRRKG
jgi:putative oxidoreductase